MDFARTLEELHGFIRRPVTVYLWTAQNDRPADSLGVMNGVLREVQEINRPEAGPDGEDYWCILDEGVGHFMLHRATFTSAYWTQDTGQTFGELHVVHADAVTVITALA